MPEQSGPPAAGQNAKTVIQMVCKFSDPEYADARCCQLKRQRYPIEPTTNLQHRRHIGIVEHEVIQCRRDPFAEQLDGRITQRLGGGQEGSLLWRKIQRCEAVKPLAFGPQWFPGGGQDTGVRGGLQDRFRQSRGRPDEVLAVVEHE